MKDLFEIILMNAPNPIIVADPDNKIVYGNKAFEVLVGERLKDISGKFLNDVFLQLQGQWEFLVAELSKAFEGIKIENGLKIQKNGSITDHARDPLIALSSREIDFIPPSVVLLKDKFYSYQIFDAGESSKERELKGIVLNDITDEKEFLDRMTQAENLSSLKTLAAGISHEISNPLHSILTFSEAIAEENDLDKIKSYAKKLVDNSTRLGNVLADFSGFVQRKKNENQRKVNIIEIIRAAVKFALLPYQSNKIAVDGKFEVLPDFVANPEDLQQIFFNIVNNAFQAMEGKGRLQITTKKTNNSLAIVFSDNGPGMPKDILRKVFNPFFTTKMQGEGTGLGLSIAHRLVTKYGGKIDIQSREGDGTEVYIYFPLDSGS
ncbi:MAG: two-component system sensor histidine kinase NtrB [Nitrospinales bacterium]